jgi:NADH dehydrogenase
MATVGRFRAIVSLKGLRLSGLLGWLTWLFVHITFLTGFANRFSSDAALGTVSFLGRSRGQLAYSPRFQRAHATGQSGPR